MTSFVERIGKRVPKTLIQTEELDRETRTSLWNVLVNFRYAFQDLSRSRPSFASTEKRIMNALWTRHFHHARDEKRDNRQVWQLMKEHILSSEWFEALDLIEAFVKHLYSHANEPLGVGSDVPAFAIEEFNTVFEEQLVGYRFIGTEITPITEERDVEAVEEALDQLFPYSGAQQHLEQAVESLSDRSSPNYAHSISEAVKAVEGVVQKLTNTKASLGDGLNKLEKAGLEIHPALKEAWRKMYGWISDDKGMRHATTEASNVDQSLAKYMLISCSAFVSYLIEEGGKKDLISVVN